MVPITKDNAIVITNITFQANKANQFIIFSSIISIVIFFSHMNCLGTLQTLAFSTARSTVVYLLHQLNLWT